MRSYFGILLDNNNRKPLARLHFNSATKYLGLFDNATKTEERVLLKSLDDIYTYRGRLAATPSFYEKGVPAPESEDEQPASLDSAEDHTEA